jgi:HNH endonuclease
MCDMHYKRWQRHGSTDSLTNRGLEVEARYWLKVDASEGIDFCHPWTGFCDKGGYGRFELTSAHRWGYLRFVGPIPDGLHVLHTCDSPPCQNHRHWFLGTNIDNIVDKVIKGRAQRLTGDTNGHAKLTWSDVDEMRALYRTGTWTHKQLGQRFGVSPTNAGDIIRERIWRHHSSTI